MGLSELIRSVHGSGELLSELDMFLVQKEEEDRSDAWHPSSFCQMCARERILRIIKRIPVKEEMISAKTKRIWDIGSALHWVYQNKYFGPMGILWGKWKCSSCGLIKWGFRPDNLCIRCRMDKGYIYLEIPVLARLPGCEKPIKGSSDGLLYIGNKWIVLEIKSINDVGFKYMKNAYPSAIVQANIYGELIRQKLVNVTGEVFIPSPDQYLVLYINKNDSTHKEFYGDLDSSVARLWLSQPIRYEKALSEKKIPSRLPICNKSDSFFAKRCSISISCFKNLDWSGYEVNNGK